jgi:hypothetical protein
VYFPQNVKLVNIYHMFIRMEFVKIVALSVCFVNKIKIDVCYVLIAV